MRLCPICTHNGKRVIMNGYDGVKAAYGEVNSVCLFECTRCGHRYVDALKLTQAWLDDYYLNRYQTDDKPYSDERLNSLAECVISYSDKTWMQYKVLDIGGMDEELVKRLRNKNVRAVPVGVGDRANEKYYDAVILSHTLEHVYDVPAMFERIKAALIPGSLLFVESPVHIGYKDPKEYDYHWQHVNKFRPFELVELFKRNGFNVLTSEQLPDYREYQCWRIVGRYES